MKRLLHLTLALAVTLSLTLSPFETPTANATPWTSLAECSSLTGAYTINKFDFENYKNELVSANLLPATNKNSASLIIYATSQPYAKAVWSTTNILQFKQNADGTKNVTSQAPYNATWSQAGFQDSNPATTTPAVSSPSTQTQYLSNDISPACIIGTQNTQYVNWTGSYYGNVISDTNLTSCPPGIAGFSCEIGSLFNSIGDGYNAVSQATLNGMAKLFVPNPDSFKDINDEISDTASTKLGLFLFPLDFFSGVWSSAKDGANQYETGANTDSMCYYTGSGNFFGSQVHLDYCAFETLNPTAFQSIQQILQLMIVTMLLFGIYLRWRNLIQRN